MKISIVGAGNAGCFTALHFAWFTRKSGIEIELIHNPDILPEKVGQATLLSPPEILYGATRADWYNNPFKATPKTGILYEGWGKVNEKVFHAFPLDRLAVHFCPSLMQEWVLNCGLFKVVEGDVSDISNIDSDYIIDCRGRPDDFSDYDNLINPINAAILGKPKWDTIKDLWSGHVATPDGWTFVIPAHPSSPSHEGSVGYLYNSNVSSQEDAEKNFIEQFDVEITRHIRFNNYVAKNPIVDNRIFLNGNRLFFLEPLEATALETYCYWTRYMFDMIIHRRNSHDQPLDFKVATNDIHTHIERCQNFVLWHYQFGSKYNTPFWDYAKSLPFKDAELNRFINVAKKIDWNDVMTYDHYGGSNVPQINKYNQYGSWTPVNLKYWIDGMLVP